MLRKLAAMGLAVLVLSSPVSADSSINAAGDTTAPNTSAGSLADQKPAASSNKKSTEELLFLYSPLDIPDVPEAGALDNARLGDKYYFGDGVDVDEAKALEYYVDAADGGNLYAANRVGTFFDNGYGGVDENVELAFAWYKAGAEKGYLPSMTNLGYMYEKGRGTDSDPEKAFEWYRRAADAGYSYGMDQVGHAYADGIGVAPDDDKAIEWLTKAAAEGVPASNWDMGVRYLKGDKVPKDLTKAADMTYFALVHGTPNSLSSFQELDPDELDPSFQKAIQQHLKEDGYYKGPINGLFDTDTKAALKAAFDTKVADPADADTALPPIKMAVDGTSEPTAPTAKTQSLSDGAASDTSKEAPASLEKAGPPDYATMDMDALVALGDDFYDGTNGQTQDYAKAFEVYTAGSDRGNAYSMLMVGVMYDRGNGVEQSYTDAFFWYRKAAEAGNVQAMANVGNMYDTGDGVKQDFKQAAEWYRKAAEKGNKDGAYYLAVLFEAGDGVDQDYEEAAGWYQKAMDAGDARAYWGLAVFHLYGRGVQKDTFKAADYAYYAITHGVQKALDEFKDIRKADTSINFRKRVQELLTKDGYYSGPIDGDFGSATQAALAKAFDTAN